MTYFTPKTLRFLKDLAANNRRDWFEAHRTAYERDVREPALRLITAMETAIREVHPQWHLAQRHTDVHPHRHRLR